MTDTPSPSPNSAPAAAASPGTAAPPAAAPPAVVPPPLTPPPPITTPSPADAKPADASAAATPPADAKPADAKPADAKPADAKPADAKPADAKPAEPPVPAAPPASAADAKLADAKPADAKPADVAAAAPPPADAKPADASPAPAPTPASAAPASALSRREQMEAAIRQRLEQELSARHGEVVAQLSRAPVAPAAPKPESAPKSAKKAKREKTPADEHAERLRLGKEAIKGRLNRLMLVLHLLIPAVCIGAVVVYLVWFREPPPPELPEKPNVIVKQTSPAPAPKHESAALQAQRDLSAMQVRQGNYMGAVEAWERFMAEYPDDAAPAKRALAKLKEEHPNETGDGPHWEFFKEEFADLQQDQTPTGIEAAVKRLVEFRRKHPSEAHVATHYLNRLVNQYRELTGKDLVVVDKQAKQDKVPERMNSGQNDLPAGGDENAPPPEDNANE